MPALAKVGVAEREKLFAAAYCKDMNAGRAAIAAGYSAHRCRSTGSSLLTRPHVQAMIQAQQTKQVKKFNMDGERIKKELFALATLDPIECLDEAGIPLPLEKMPPHVRACVKSLQMTLGENGVTSCRLEFWSKTEALKLSAQHLSLLAPTEVSVTVRFPHAELSDAELRQKLLESANTLEHVP